MRLTLTTLIFVCALINFEACAHNVPPGLQKKGMITVPAFLGKTPPGWDEGLKRGWNKNSNWHWDKKSGFWENQDWRWDAHTKRWKKINR